jgi:isopenicillin-N epimerase
VSAPEPLESFFLDPDRTYLNHASYGAPTRALMAHADAIRAELERDTELALGLGLAPRLGSVADRLGRELGLTGGQMALTINATEANNALAASYDLRPGDRVVLAATEYSSVIEAWALACRRQSAHLVVVHLPLPITQDALLDRLDDALTGARLTVVSAIASSTAMRAPLAEVLKLAEDHGTEVFVDASHVLGHDEFDELGQAAAVFGTTHKWIPAPRSSGFLWLADDSHTVSPALVALSRGADSMLERFSWRGTWDPATLLALPAALDEAERWRARGLLAASCALADELASDLEQIGLIPAVDPSLVAPRMRSFVVPGADKDSLRTFLRAKRVSVPVPGDLDDTAVRFAINVYNTAADAQRLVQVLRDYIGGSRAA